MSEIAPDASHAHVDPAGEDEDYTVVSITDQSGIAHQFALLDIFDFEDRSFAILDPLNPLEIEDMKADEVLVMEIVEVPDQPEHAMFVSIEDEDEMFARLMAHIETLTDGEVTNAELEATIDPDTKDA